MVCNDLTSFLSLISGQLGRCSQRSLYASPYLNPYEYGFASQIQKKISGKGVGCIASQDIEKGTVILREKPQFAVKGKVRTF